MMKKLMVSLGLMLVVLGGVTVVTNAWAADDVCSDPKISTELKKVAGCSDFDAGASKTAVPLAINIINVVVSLVGVIAVGVVVYGGFLYITSTGDASKATKGKNSILYGLVGLVVAVMAFAIVAFVNASVLQK